MNVQNKSIYQFGSFQLDPAQHILLRDGQIVPLTPKVFETLKVLIESNGQVVDKDELLQKVWSDTVVEESSLAKNISVLRKVLNENESGKSYIETIPKRGYRFTVPVEDLEVISPEVDVADKDIPKSNLSAKKKIGLITAILILLSSLIFAGYWQSKSKFDSSKTTSDVKTIAVLPFNSLNNNEEDQALGLGMADALIIKLGQLDKVIVRPTSNVKQFINRQQTDPVSIGQSLRVEAVFEGTMQRTADRIRITAQLINVADGRQIWSDKFEEKTTDFFVLQDAIAMRVANSLVPQLTDTERQKLARRGTNNPEALRLLVLGNNWSNQETTEGFNKAVEYLNKAIELDPNFAYAYLGLSYAYHDASESHMPPQEAMTKAKFYAERALQMDETMAQAHYQLAWTKMLYEWDWAGAESGFKRALELNPNHSHAHFGYGTFLSLMGRRQEALAELERAKNINGIDIIGSNILYRVGEYDRAIVEANKALELAPRRISSLQWLAMCYEYKGMFAEALSAYEKARKVEDTPELKAFQARTFALMGNHTEALMVIDELKEISKQKYVSPFYLAVIYAGLSDNDQTLVWLEKAYEDRSWWIATLKANPQFDSLRDDARFQDLLRRVRL
jgi:DNA-binding winged helix-turn-helix (wHTH) protein/TolB-like protein/tetratricopeptide (TPR) repeat protein